MKICFVIVLAFNASLPASVNAKEWVSIGPDGKLVYAQDDRGNSIPDFSNCGYQGGGVALPANTTNHCRHQGRIGPRCRPYDTHPPARASNLP